MAREGNDRTLSEPAMIDVKQEAIEAERRIRPHIRETPVEYSPYLSQLGNGRVFLKLENLQITGSFKLRGAVNKFLSLGPEQRRTHLVTASSGNHANAFAYVMKRFGARGTIYLPQNASPAKVEALRFYGTELEFCGDDCVQSEIFARHSAAGNGQIYVSPYNDPQIIGGQATVGIEVERQVEHIDAVLVPVGGGGLIAGVAGYLKSCDPGIEIVGCQPQNSCVMFESIRAGEIVDLESKPTLSDGTAGGIEHGAITLDLCTAYVDEFFLAGEEEIAGAIRLLLERHHLLVEGSGALSVACFIQEKEKFDNKDVVLVLSGCKISLDDLKQVLDSK